MTASRSRLASFMDDGDPALSAAIARRLLEAMDGDGPVAAGQAYIVSLAPIKAALGPTWETARGKILSVVERSFAKHLPEPCLWRPAGDTMYLAAAPDKSAAHALALCHRALKDTVVYFQGRIRPTQIEICRIVSLNREGGQLQPVSIHEMEAAEDHADIDDTQTAAPAAAPAHASHDELDSWQLKTSDGRSLRASFAIDPVMDLKAWAMAGHRIDSRVVMQSSGAELTPQQRLNLQPWDFEKIDTAALERGMSRLNGEIPDKPKLIVQLSFSSLSTGRTRNSLLDLIRDPEHGMKQAAICEIVDVESGVPLGRLTEVAAMVRSFFRGVWVQVEPRKHGVETALASKVTGLTVRAADLGGDDQSIANGMRRFTAMVKRPGFPLIVTSLPAANLMIDAVEAGFSHATLRTRPRPETAG